MEPMKIRSIKKHPSGWMSKLVFALFIILLQTAGAETEAPSPGAIWVVEIDGADTYGTDPSDVVDIRAKKVVHVEIE